jgi:hypothetical protein
MIKAKTADNDPITGTTSEASFLLSEEKSAHNARSCAIPAQIKRAKTPGPTRLTSEKRGNMDSVKYKEGRYTIIPKHVKIPVKNTYKIGVVTRFEVTRYLSNTATMEFKN